jgi:hypothetical protein
MEIDLGAVWPGETQIFSENACFLCGIDLTSETRTDEDVFPRWLLGEFNIWNARLDLLNGTSIKYAQLKIPCCGTCNNEFLSRIENKVRTAYAGGYEAVCALDRDILFLWLAKILYGLMVREMYLPLDRRDKSSGPIVEPDFLSQFRMLHYLLQAVIERVEWEGNPASVLLYRTQASETPERNFDFADGPFGPFLSMRLGTVGIIAVLQDWGALEAHAWAQLTWAKELELAPLQFREVMAIGRFWAYKFNRVPNYLVDQRDGRGHVTVIPLGGLSAKSLWDEFDHEEYAHMLAASLGVSVDRVHVGDQLRTFLRDDQDHPCVLPFDARFA